MVRNGLAIFWMEIGLLKRTMYIYSCIYIYTYVYIFLCICMRSIYIYIHMYAYVYVYIYIYRHICKDILYGCRQVAALLKSFYSLLYTVCALGLDLPATAARALCQRFIWVTISVTATRAFLELTKSGGPNSLWNIDPKQ